MMNLGPKQLFDMALYVANKLCNSGHSFDGPIGFMISAAIFIVISGSSYYRMLAEINRHAPPNEQVSEVLWLARKVFGEISPSTGRWNPGVGSIGYV